MITVFYQIYPLGRDDKP